MKLKDIRGVLFFLMFCVAFVGIWSTPEHNIMTIHDWMRLIVLEVPLQLAIKVTFEKDC